MHRRPLSAGCAAAAGLALVAAPALASSAPADGPPPLTVYVGGNDSGTYHFKGVSKGPVIFGPGSLVSCAMSTIGGTITAGPSDDGHPGEIDSATFTDCAADSLFSATVNASGLPWALNIDNVTGPSSADGDIAGFGASIDLNTSLADCAFDVGGAVNIELDVQADGTGQQLTTAPDPTLTLSNVSSGCLGLINNGDTANFQATYGLTVTDQAGNPIPNPPIGFTNP